MVKDVLYLPAARASLLTYRSEAKRIIEKIERYATTGGGDVTQLTGSSAKRLRVGSFRVIFEESETSLIITSIGHRRDIYD